MLNSSETLMVNTRLELDTQIDLVTYLRYK